MDVQWDEVPAPTRAHFGATPGLHEKVTGADQIIASVMGR
jgi:hypothetical protein